MIAADTSGASSLTYRAYKLDGEGHFVAVQIVIADSDDQARRCARSLAITQPVELWHRSRFLGRFDPDHQCFHG